MVHALYMTIYMHFICVCMFKCVVHAFYVHFPYMHFPAFYVHFPYMHSTCIFHTFILSAFCHTCILCAFSRAFSIHAFYVHFPYMHSTCIFHISILSAFSIHAFYVHFPYMHSTCVFPYMHSTCVFPYMHSTCIVYVLYMWILYYQCFVYILSSPASLEIQVFGDIDCTLRTVQQCLHFGLKHSRGTVYRYR